MPPSGALPSPKRWQASRSVSPSTRSPKLSASNARTSMTPRSPSRPKSPDRLAAEVLGRRGEMLAAWYLRAKLYRIRDMRFKTAVGEIDIVAERAGTIAFVEVKSRTRTETDFDPLLA